MKQKLQKKNAIKAFKAFNSDWTCRGFLYAVGQEYKADSAISLCSKGFHACENASDCFNYYGFNPSKTRMAEVLCWGEVEKSEESSKLCCSRIKIIRELDWYEVLKICNPGYGNSGYGNSGNGNSGDCNTGSWNPGDRNTGNRNSGNWNTGSCNSGDSNSGHSNSGNRNPGSCNSGGRNSGDWNTGNCNSGNYNSGHSNSGNRNSGNLNSGYGNSGYRNSGSCNTGYWNSGSWNSGNCNTGRWNSGDWNTGYFNTHTPNKMFCFNKLTEKQEIRVPDFLYFELTEWVPIAEMTAAEKEEHPECAVTGGYLRSLEYKDAFRKSFLKAKKGKDWPEELETLKAIPNFDYDIFEEISGISKEELEGDVI